MTRSIIAILRGVRPDEAEAICVARLARTFGEVATIGADPANFVAWLAVGVDGSGIGTAVYKPGDSATQVKVAAREIVRAYDAAIARQVVRRRGRRIRIVRPTMAKGGPPGISEGARS